MSKYISQLIVLSRLRKFESETIKIINEMPITYDIKTDYLFKQGIEQGIEQGSEQGIEKNRIEVILTGWKNGIELSSLALLTSLNQYEVMAIIEKHIDN
jgi:hypothetical protein